MKLVYHFKVHTRPSLVGKEGWTAFTASGTFCQAIPSDPVFLRAWLESAGSQDIQVLGYDKTREGVSKARLAVRNLWLTLPSKAPEDVFRFLDKVEVALVRTLDTMSDISNLSRSCLDDLENHLWAEFFWATIKE